MTRHIRDHRDKKNRKAWMGKAGLIVFLSLCLVCAGSYYVALQIEKTLWYPSADFFSFDSERTGWRLRVLGKDFYISKPVMIQERGRESP